MKSKLLVAVILAIAAVCSIGAAAPVAQAIAESQKPHTLVVLGDSIASEYGVGVGHGYPSLVAGDKNLVLENYAVAGWRTEQVINQLTTDESAKEAVKNADAIQITIGGNDLQQAGYVGPSIDAIMQGDTSLWEQQCADTAARFANIVTLVRALNPDAPFFVFNSYTPDYKRYGAINIASSIGAKIAITGNQLFDIAQNYAIPYWNSSYEAYLQQNPSAFILVDIFDAFPGNASSYYSSADVIHPSVAGHQMLRERLDAAIDTYNSENIIVTPSAQVNKLTGNKNLLTVVVTESFPLAAAKTIETSFSIDNNSSGYYYVGDYTVYVDTKGNTQIRECYIAA